MCYRVDIKTDISKLIEFTGRTCETPELYTPRYHVTGFEHPLLAVITCENPNLLQLCTWGFVPYYTKTEEQVKKYADMMLNARIETLWQLPSFKRAAEYKRCLIIVDGFFEYHNWGSKKVPYYISRNDKMPMVLGGIYDNVVVEGVERFTCAIVTAPAEGRILGKIHNRVNADPRTPYIIHSGVQNEWISQLPQGPVVQEFAAEELDSELAYWPVTNQMAKKGYNPNNIDISKPVEYKGLSL